MLTLGSGGLNQILDDPEVTVQGNAVVVSSMVNQFRTNMEPIRLDFQDRSEKSPARQDFGDRVVRMADFVAQQNRLTYNALGLNFDIGFECVTEQLAREVILNRFVKLDALATSGYDPVGASVRFWYMVGEIRHYLYIEPQGNSFDASGYHSHINVHYKLLENAPSSEWLTAEITKEYHDFTKVLSNIFGN